jgi:DNA-directed RNA polymerase subunit E'/Rpb7
MEKEREKERKKVPEKEREKDSEDIIMPGNSLFVLQELSSRVYVSMSEVGRYIRKILLLRISRQIEGRCIVEGYVAPGSVRMVKYSSGQIDQDRVKFDVVYQCRICNPVEGQVLRCVAKEVTMAGIHASIEDRTARRSMMEVFLAHDHNYMHAEYSDVKEGTRLKVKVIGKRFELNDAFITVAAFLLEIDRPTLSKGQKRAVEYVSSNKDISNRYKKRLTTGNKDEDDDGDENMNGVDDQDAMDVGDDDGFF